MKTGKSCHLLSSGVMDYTALEACCSLANEDLLIRMDCRGYQKVWHLGDATLSHDSPV